MKKVYYIEICTASDDDYSLQTKNFTSRQEAEIWFDASIDFISDNITARMMVIEFEDPDGDNYDIEDLGYYDNYQWIYNDNNKNN